MRLMLSSIAYLFLCANYEHAVWAKSTSTAGRLLDDVSMYTFDDFVSEFERSYPDEAEYQKRKIIFEKNLEIITSHNKNRQNGHVLGVNHFADQEADEIPRGYDKMQSTARFHGTSSSFWLVSNNNNKSAKQVLEEEHLPFTVEDVENLPPAVDWRAAGVTTPVKSQGGCGSCWAFAATAVLESHIALETGVLFELSEQELVSCVSNPRNCGGSGGCKGATAELAYDFVVEKGMVQEWDFGYESYHGETVACKLPNASDLSATSRSLEQRVRSSTSVRSGSSAGSLSSYFKGAVASIDGYMVLPTNNYKVLMNAVAKFGPVAVAVACLPWQFYQGGIFYHPLNTTTATDVDHLVVLEGYGTDKQTGEDYWLVRNSWGPLWGEHGYIRLWRVDPSTLSDPEDDCGMDENPDDGLSCTKDDAGNDVVPPPVKVCGNSGILFDAVVPFGGHLLK